MRTFLWVIIVLMALSAIGKLIHLVGDSGPRETPRWSDGFDIVANAALIAWAIALL
jgi:hypothetical protein